MTAIAENRPGKWFGRALRAGFASVAVSMALSTATRAQFAAPAASSLGHALVAAGGAWGGRANPAAHARSAGPAVQAYGRTYLSLDGLATFGLDAAVPLHGGWASAHLAQARPPGLRYTAYRLGYAMPLGEGFDVGLRLGALHSNLGEYGDRTDVLASVGAQAQVSTLLRVGVAYHHAPRGERLLAEHGLRAGVARRMSDALTAFASLEQALGKPLAVGAGLAYRPRPEWEVRLGYRSRGGALGFGTAYALSDRLRLNLDVVVYQRLPSAVHYGVEYASPAGVAQPSPTLSSL